MRTEYTIKTTYPNGKTDFSTYPKKYAFEKAEDIKKRYTDCTVEFFKVLYNGNSFYKAKKIF